MGKPTFLYDIVIADDNGDEMPVDEEGYYCENGRHKPNGILPNALATVQKNDVFKHDLYYTGDKAYKMLMATSGLSAGMMTLLKLSITALAF